MVTNNKTLIRHCAFLIFSISLFYSCSFTTQNEIKSTENQEEKIEVNKSQEMSKNEIYFLTLTISKTEDQKHSKIQLVRKTKVNGSFKTNRLDNIYKNRLTIEVYHNNQFTRSFNMEHPLIKQMEYATETSQLISKTTTLKQNEFSIRIQTKESTSCKIKIYETLNNQTQKELITINL